MKKTVIGMAVMAGLMFAGQASADTLRDAMFATPVGPYNIKYTGYAQTIGGVTSGIFFLNQWFYGPATGMADWNAGESGTYGYAIFSGIVDDASSATPGGIKATGGTWSLWQTTSYFDLEDIGNAPGTITGAGTQLLYGDFAAQDALGHTLVETFDVAGNNTVGSGDMFGNILGGDTGLVTRLNANKRAFGSDISFSWHYSATLEPNWVVSPAGPGYLGVLVTDPAAGDAVPEPATMLLFGAGLAGLAGLRRKRSR